MEGSRQMQLLRRFHHAEAGLLPQTTNPLETGAQQGRRKQIQVQQIQHLAAGTVMTYRDQGAVYH